jgi:hypothetical protein
VDLDVVGGFFDLVGAGPDEWRTDLVSEFFLDLLGKVEIDVSLHRV